MMILNNRVDEEILNIKLCTGLIINFEPRIVVSNLSVR